MTLDYGTIAASLVAASPGTGTRVVTILFAVGLLGGGGAVIYFAGRALGQAQDPDITVTNSQTGQSAKVGKGGLVVFILLGILLAIGGIALLVGGIKG